MSHPRFRNRISVAALSLGLAALAPTASADLSNVIFRIEATNSQGSGVFEATSDQGSWDGDTYTWVGGGIDIRNESGDVIASLMNATFVAIADPQVGILFDVVAGATDTQFTISSGELSFPTIFGATGVASAGLTVTDAGQDNGALATGNGGSGNSAYQANYNGLIPAGTIFAEFIRSVVVATPGGTETGVGSTGGFLNIPDPVSSMSAQYSFLLSALDSASGTSNFVVIPEPASLVLLALGATALIRRR
ncbi:MAG: PEP-CTERM sorting domain-containing protein [Phycisphaerales bacterium]|nr:PEP-CTERM sorting domain-containing protein [Phycisphaerales bacterium]